MSGPNAPPMNMLAGLLGRQQMPQPAPRSQASQRIMAARGMNVDPSQVTQQPGYKPPAQAAPQGPAAPASGGGPAPAPTPLPQPRPQAAPPRQAGAPGISPADFMRQALEMEAAKRSMPVAPAQAGPPPASPQDFMRQVQAMQARNPMNNVPTPGVREATPEEISAKQKQDMAAAIAARSGGEQQAAPAARGAVTPPAPSVAPSPVPPPPPVGVKPRGDFKSGVDPEAKKFKYPKSTGKSAENRGSNANYYAILGVQPGDNVGASRAFAKLEERERTNPSSITMEEDKLLASSRGSGYRQSLEPQAVEARFKKRGDPAETEAYTTIEKAGTPQIKKAPTQEDVNLNPGAYKTRNKADVETDTAVQATESED